MQIPAAWARDPLPLWSLADKARMHSLSSLRDYYSAACDGDQMMMTHPGQVTITGSDLCLEMIPVCIHGPAGGANVPWSLSGPGCDQVMRLIISVGPSQPAYISLAPDDLLCLLSTFFMSLQIMIVSVETQHGQHRIISRVSQ